MSRFMALYKCSSSSSSSYYYLSDDIFLCQNVELGSSTQAQHGRRSVGDEGARPPTFRPEGVSLGNVLILLQFIKQIYRHIDGD